MEAKLIRIGNSQGLRLPKALLLQTGMTERVEIEARGQNIILKPVRNLRDGWEKSFSSSGGELTDEDHAWLNAELASGA